MISYSNLDYEVVIVDDNSPDGTLEVAKELEKLFGKNRIVIHSRPCKMGLGSAYIDGLKICKGISLVLLILSYIFVIIGDYVFLMDADLSHNPKHMPEFVK